MSGPWEKYAAQPADDGPWAKYQAPASAPQPQQQPGFLDRMADQPLTSHLAATEAGLANVAQGVGQAVKGAYDTFKGPETTGEKVASAVAGPAGVAALRTVKGAVSTGSQASQVPAAISDINQSADPAGTYASVAGKTAGQAGGQALAAIAAEKVPSALKVVNDYRQVPQAISRDTIDTLNTFSKKEGLPEIKATTARDAFDELQQNLMSRAKAQYKVVDNAVGGDLKPVQEKIIDLKKSIRVNENVNPDLADKQKIQLADQQTKLQDLIDRAKQNGLVDADQIMQKGDRDYSRAIATEKVANGVKTASGQVKMGGHPHPGGYASQIDRASNAPLRKVPSLDRAVGPDTAEAIRDVAREGLKRSMRVGKAKNTAIAAGGILTLEEGVRRSIKAIKGN